MEVDVNFGTWDIKVEWAAGGRKQQEIVFRNTDMVVDYFIEHGEFEFCPAFLKRGPAESIHISFSTAVFKFVIA